MTSQQFLVCDASTVANFKQWGQAISTFFSTAGWVQGSDTGQVNWGTISTVPGSNAYVYEIWKPGDALHVFYVRIEYGNVGSANSPALRLTIGTATDGAGNLTGFVTAVSATASSGITPPSTTTQYECDFSGSNNRIAAMLWRNAPSGVQQLFAIERSLDATGTPTGAYVTLWTLGNASWSAFQAQQSLLFSVGPAPRYPSAVSNSGGWMTRMKHDPGVDLAFNGTIPFDTASPMIGYFDYPCTVVGLGYGPDFAEAVPYTVTLYGAARTYLPSKSGLFGLWTTNSNLITCMRYD